MNNRMLFDSEIFQKPRTKSSLILKISKTQNCEFFDSDFFQNRNQRLLTKLENHTTLV